MDKYQMVIIIEIKVIKQSIQICIYIIGMTSMLCNAYHDASSKRSQMIFLYNMIITPSFVKMTT